MKAYFSAFKNSGTAAKVFGVLFIAAGLLLFTALIPATVIGVINTGTYAGYIIALVTFVTGLFMPLYKTWRSKTVKLIYRVVIVVFALLAAYAVVLSGLMISKMQDAPEKDSDRVVVVLGCQVKESGPSLMLQKRLEATLGYLSGTPDAICIVSGGQGDDEHMSEAQAMYDWLTENGIDGGRIFMEDRSTSTEENLAFSKEILKELGKPTDIILVTDGFHQYRASLMAENEGYNIKTLCSDTPYFLVPVYWIREWFALSFMFVFGNGAM